jgi:hypothetical protein
MDLRAAVIVACIVVTGGAAAAQENADSLAALDALEAESALDPDVVLRAEWDALLADPVDINRGDLERLRVLAWLDGESLAALAAGRPFASLAEIEHLPGWDAWSLQRLRPFVVLHAPRHRAPRWQAHLAWSASATRMRLDSGGLALNARIDPDVPERTTGTLRWRGRHLAIGAGDVRAGHAQGLLLWTATQELRAGSAVWRGGRGTSGLDGATRDHALRGASAEWLHRRGGFFVASGTHAQGRGFVAGTSLRPFTGCELQLAALELGTLRAASLGAGLGTAPLRAAFELAGWNRAWAGTAALELRRGTTRFVTRLQVTPGDVPLPFGVLPATVRRTASREAAATIAWRRGTARFELGVATSRRDGSDATQRLHHEATCAVTTTEPHTRMAISCRLGRRTTRTLAWDGGARLLADADTDWSGAVQLRRDLRPGWSGVAVLRAAWSLPLAAAARSGRAWQVRCERQAGRVRPAFGLGAFAVDPGILLVESAPAGGLGTARLRGDGLRLSAAVHGQWLGFDVRGGAWRAWRGADGDAAGGAASVALQLP